jgi:hypothetical protein
MANQINVRMPSRGLLPDTVEEVTIREMTVKEEKGLFSSKRPFQKIVDLIKSCIAEPMDLNIRKLPLSEIVFLLFQLRKLSLGSDYKYKLVCTSCGRNLEKEISLNDFEVRYLRDGAMPTYSCDLPSGRTISFRYLIGEDQIDIDNVVRMRGQKAGQNFDNGFVYKLAKQIHEVDGQQLSMPEKEMFVDSLTHSELEIVNNTIDNNEFGIDLSVIIDCQFCGNLDEVIIPITQDFLFRGGSKSRETTNNVQGLDD